VVQPPPVVVYQPAPTYQYPEQYQLPPPSRAAYTPAPQRNVWVGLYGALSGAFLDTATGVNGPGFLGGGNVGLRFRGRGNFGGELGVGLFGGRDYNGDNRTEVPVTANALFFVNPQNSFQFYFLAGLGLSFANVDYTAANRAAHAGRHGDDYSYFGGDAGLGAELQLSPRFSLFADARVFLRTRVDSSTTSNPEFARTTASGTTQTTNTSTGVLTQIGAALYF
jgi:hypothetical protein